MKLQSSFVLASLAVLAFCTGSATRVSAQRSSHDTLTVLKKFVAVSNLYKQRSLFLDFGLKNSSNIITRMEDTVSFNAVMYLQGENAYIRFGDVEQLITDSTAVVVNKKERQLFVFPEKIALGSQVSYMAGAVFMDSSIVNLAKRFTAREQEGVSPSIQLTGRTMIPGTSFVRESMELVFDRVRNEPLRLTTTRRTLIPIDEANYALLSAEDKWKGWLLGNEAKEYFIIKEQVSSFVYNKVSYESAVMPVNIADRVVGDNANGFVLAKGYETYTLILN